MAVPFVFELLDVFATEQGHLRIVVVRAITPHPPSIADTPASVYGAEGWVKAIVLHGLMHDNYAHGSNQANTWGYTYSGAVLTQLDVSSIVLISNLSRAEAATLYRHAGHG